MAVDETPIQQLLSFPIMLSERIHHAVIAANTFKSECFQVGKQSERIAIMLRSAVRYASSNNSFYDTPVRRIVTQVSNNLSPALTLVHKCRSRNVLTRVFNIVTAADFKTVFCLLDASLGDLKWMLNLFYSDASAGGEYGIILSLPPIATNDPVLSWIWSFIASIYVSNLDGQIDAINELSSVAKDNDRNKIIIVAEGGVPPLIKLLKECDSPNAQIAVANALFILANDEVRVRVIAKELGVKAIVGVLGSAPMRVQIVVADLVARMAEFDSMVREEFARENAIRPLVTLLSFVDDLQRVAVGKQSEHSIVQINKQIENNGLSSFSYKLGAFHSEGGGGVYGRRERGNETREMKLKLKISSSQALRMLARGSVSNSKRITETKGLLCLAKHIETAKGELQLNCLLTIMEITAAAEADADLRRAAFKTNSPAAKAVVDQLVKLIQDSNNPTLQIPAMRSIGSLARTFPTRETRVLVPIVSQLGNQNQDVSTEAAISLGKFACPDNFLCVEHTKTIIEYGGMQSLMRLLRGNEIAKFYGVVLLCYLALHIAEKEVSAHGRMLTALEGAERTYTTQSAEFKELISNAIRRLSVYHSEEISVTVSYASQPHYIY
ncbi:ARM REPEAT PROTEIN INTERACTING WITH ABF2 [Heracleum sosnowskyi]|uniref:ARM REPEAT PROTEIN INTERACTING WITH ABF2 n=1 Tax=Heracleum sosnowskyi TaxID=360622 RepID=A0AAD8M9K2_9APIA|nr:ARM REPEAT PROTEIN INTERACTING WITH ABF2 [Heracleum sosnowskyi]